MSGIRRGPLGLAEMAPSKTIDPAGFPRAEVTMTNVRATLTIAVDKLDRHADQGELLAVRDLRLRVARPLARQFAQHNGWGGFTKVTTKEVRAVLIAYGASTFTIKQHARAIAAMIRADFSEGR
jgi:hypothetical protein